MNTLYPYNDELYHHGVKGMKWGILRSRTAVLYDKNPGHKATSKNSSSDNHYEGNVYKKSLKGNLHRLSAANYNLNSKVYRKLGNKTMASMNEHARNQALKKAAAADKKRANAVIKRKQSKAGGSSSTRSKLNGVSTTKRRLQEAGVLAGGAAVAGAAYGGYSLAKKLRSRNRNSNVSSRLINGSKRLIKSSNASKRLTVRK